MVALAMLMMFPEPSDFDRMSPMPASVQIARTAGPAMRPVPSLAGLRRTRPAPNSPIVECGSVRPVSGTRMSEPLAFSTALLMASGTSLALPEPRPIGLARAEADVAVAVADDDEGREREAASALHNLGDAVEGEDFLFEVHAAGVDGSRLPGRAREGDVVHLEDGVFGGFEFVFVLCHDQNLIPCSRTASAKALTTPW
jgi:hypothetical protein